MLLFWQFGLGRSFRIHRTHQASIFSLQSNTPPVQFPLTSSLLSDLLRSLSHLHSIPHQQPVHCALTPSHVHADRSLFVIKLILTSVLCVKWHILFPRRRQQQIMNNDWQDRDEKTVMHAWLCSLLRRVSCLCILIQCDSRSMSLPCPKGQSLVFLIVHLKLVWTPYWQVLVVIQNQMKPSQESSWLRVPLIYVLSDRLLNPW